MVMFGNWNPRDFILFSEPYKYLWRTNRRVFKSDEVPLKTFLTCLVLNMHRTRVLGLSSVEFVAPLFMTLFLSRWSVLVTRSFPPICCTEDSKTAYQSKEALA